MSNDHYKYMHLSLNIRNYFIASQNIAFWTHQGPLRPSWKFGLWIIYFFRNAFVSQLFSLKMKINIWIHWNHCPQAFVQLLQLQFHQVLYLPPCARHHLGHSYLESTAHEHRMYAHKQTLQLFSSGVSSFWVSSRPLPLPSTGGDISRSWFRDTWVDSHNKQNTTKTIIHTDVSYLTQVALKFNTRQKHGIHITLQASAVVPAAWRPGSLSS